MKSGIEVDISIRNSVPDEEPATRNTRLMSLYRKENRRLTNIFKIFKRVIRGTHVSSASTSGVSSYGYSILFFFFLRKNKYIQFINPWTYEIGSGELNLERDGAIFVKFLQFVAGEGARSQVIDLKRDPAIVTCMKNEGPLPHIEAIYEEKDLTKALNQENYGKLKNICMDIRKELGQDFGLSNKYNPSKLFHRPLTEQDSETVKDFLQSLKEKIANKYI